MSDSASEPSSKITEEPKESIEDVGSNSYLTLVQKIKSTRFDSTPTPMSDSASEPAYQTTEHLKNSIEDTSSNSYLAVVQKINTIGPQQQGPAKATGVRTREEDVTMEFQEPPTKRARIEQDSPQQTRISDEQKRHIEGALKALMKHPAAVPFLVPVDPVQANIPTYFDVIKQPMDLGTIQSKLMASPCAYDTLQSFVNDVDLVFDNCYRFNGLAHSISHLGVQLQTEFQRQMRQLPESANLEFRAIPEVIPLAIPPALPPKKPSNTAIKKIIPPPVYTPATLSSRSRRDPLRIAQVKFCKTALDHLYRKEYETWVFPFLRPVDLSEFPNYLEVIKNPMDLGTIRDKLSHAVYGTAEEFHKDVKLMFTNCYTYNPDWAPGICQRSRKVFDSKWKELPLEVEVQEKSSRRDAKKHVGEGPVLTQLRTRPNKTKPRNSTASSLTENQKIELCDALWELPDAKLDEVIELIRKRLPQYRNNVETMSLDFEHIPPAVQCEMFDFLGLKSKVVQDLDSSTTLSSSDSEQQMDTSDDDS
ncbi:Bromodomain-containing factor 1 [Serendipita indica DSM 11827]|nr:Bromodomain-containing factor 1 [Serendipita indica DSM 11827]